jgi:hypothetical protein
LRTSDGLKLTDSNQNYLIIKETNWFMETFKLSYTAKEIDEKLS